MTRVTEERFAFGKNWQSYVDRVLSDDAIGEAVESLQRLLCRQSLEGLSFLDIGSGSGLFSLAAARLGATVTSFDYDRDSVEATARVRDRFPAYSGRWTVTQGSILDDAFLASLPSFDVVYSWGVLHHTGDMWRAIDNAAQKVKPGGLFAIAIYNNVEKRVGGSQWWWRIKKKYASSSTPVRRLIEWSYASIIFSRKLATLRSPLRYVREYGQENPRGMDFWHDLRDWVGGFPYEFATAGQVFNTVRTRHGYELLYLNTHDGHTCEELTFLRPA